MDDIKKGFELKPDTPSILNRGTATPYIAIFNSQSKPIICPKNGLPLGTFVKSFEYVYQEEEEDTGELLIETDNPNLLDHQDLQYYSTLFLQWGYIFEDSTFYCGPVRRVIIIGMSIRFTEMGTTINLKVASPGILYKTVPSNYYDNIDGLKDYIVDLLEGDFVGEAALIDYNNVESTLIPMFVQRSQDNQTVVFTQNDSQPHGLFIGSDQGFPNILHEVPQNPYLECPNQAGITLLQYNPQTKQLAENFPDSYRKVWIKSKEANTYVITGISKNKYQQQKAFAKSLPSGPYFVDYRDDKVIIHNRAVNRPVYRVYTYAGGNGEVLQFSVESEFVHKSVEISKSTQLDPESKAINTVVVQGLGNVYAGNVDGFATWGTGFMWDGRESTDTGINHASNNRVGSQSNPSILSDTRHLNPDGTPTSLLQRDQEFFYQDTTPTKVEAREEFSSVSQAKAYISEHWHQYIGEAEILSYFRQIKAQFDTWIKSTDIDKSIHNMQSLPNYVIKLKIRLSNVFIPDAVATGVYLLQQDKTPEELVNLLQSGDLDLSSPSYSSITGRPGVDQSFSSYGVYNIGGRRYQVSDALNKVQEVITQAGGNVILHKELNPSGGLLNPKKVTGSATFEVELEVPIAGVNLLADERFLGTADAMGNELEESVTANLTANGTFLGDPIMESSFNIQMQNVSQKYTGIWYSKRVVHKISSESGYLMDIEFVQRSIPISRRIIKSTWSHTSYAKDIHKAAKEALVSGSWQQPDNIIQDTQKKFTESAYSVKITGTDKGHTVKATKDKVRFDNYADIPGKNTYTAPPDNYVELNDSQD